MRKNAFASAPYLSLKSLSVASELFLSSGETTWPSDRTYLASFSGFIQYLKTSHAWSLFLLVESMNSAWTLIRAETFLGCWALGVNGWAASPHRNWGRSARLKMPFIATLPVRNESWLGVARMAFSSWLVGMTWCLLVRSIQNWSPCWKPGVLIVIFLLAMSSGP